MYKMMLVVSLYTYMYTSCIYIMTSPANLVHASTTVCVNLYIDVCVCLYVSIKHDKTVVIIRAELNDCKLENYRTHTILEYRYLNKSTWFYLINKINNPVYITAMICMTWLKSVIPLFSRRVYNHGYFHYKSIRVTSIRRKLNYVV